VNMTLRDVIPTSGAGLGEVPDAALASVRLADDGSSILESSSGRRSSGAGGSQSVLRSTLARPSDTRGNNKAPRVITKLQKCNAASSQSFLARLGIFAHTHVHSR
jgi:hypothetical protein